jgi:hypothetical protein
MDPNFKFAALVLISLTIMLSCAQQKAGPTVAAPQKEDRTIRAQSSTAPGNIPKDSVEGDFDGDGKKEYVWMVSPQIDSTGMGCVGDCDCFLKFSNPDIPFIKLPDCIGGAIINHGDLNGDGADEIGLLPDWFTSCWRNYYVFTLRHKKWTNAVDPIQTNCNQWEAGAIPIEKDPKRKGYAIIRYSTLDTNFHIVEKSVKLY